MCCIVCDLCLVVVFVVSSGVVCLCVCVCLVCVCVFVGVLCAMLQGLSLVLCVCVIVCVVLFMCGVCEVLCDVVWHVFGLCV